jgi:UDP-glucose 4-epimerase
MLRLAGKPTLPIASPVFGPLVQAGKRLGLTGTFSDDFSRLLRYGRAVDTRRLTEEVGFQPLYSTVAAVQDYLAKQSGRRVVPSLRQVVPG